LTGALSNITNMQILIGLIIVVGLIFAFIRFRSTDNKMNMTVTPGMVSSLQILKESDLSPPLRLVKRGKVRDVYADGRHVYLVTTDRISAFDVVSEQGVPYKGCALNQASAFGFEKTKGIVPNHFISAPDPNVTVAEAYTPVKVEAIARGYLAGSAWRQYEKGRREFFGTRLPEGMVHGQKFETALFTPTTKADAGHDVDLHSWQDFVNIIGSEGVARKIRNYTIELYAAGDLETRWHGGILVDTKGKDSAQYESDNFGCQQYAESQSVASNAAAGAGAGALFGLLVGAVIDRDNMYQYARAGAVGGLAGGATGGVQNKNEIYRNCMTRRGYSVLN